MPTAAPKRKKMRRLRPAQFILPAVILAIVMAYVLLFAYNRWEITITMKGEETITMEYGETYTDPGAEAYIHGTRFFTQGWPLHVSVHNTVDTSTVGVYPVTYAAEKYHVTATRARMITVVDTQAPEITLVDDPDYYTLPGAAYEEQGFTAVDGYDGDITDQVVRTEEKGKILYTVSDSSGNETSVERIIRYDDPIPPELKLKGDKEIKIVAGSDYTEPGWTAEDNCDGDITDRVKVKGSVDTYSAGTYELVYSVKDNYGNKVKAKRTVIVTPIRQPDTVTPKGKIIYLTFDDGPGPYTQKLLDVLADHNVKATFFTCKTEYPDLLAKEAKAGHSIAIHSASHDYSKIYSSVEAYFKDLNKQKNLIKKKTGIDTTLIRFPGGSSNEVSKRYCTGIMTKLVKDVTDQGYQYFDWNVASGDAGQTTSSDQVFKNVIEGVQKHDVSIVLQHDIKDFSVNAVDRIIVWGLSHGYTFLPLDATSPGAHQTVCN